METKIGIYAVHFFIYCTYILDSLDPQSDSILHKPYEISF